MSTVNAERVGPAVGPEKKISTLTLTGRNGIVHRYFYFAMSLLVAAIVVDGFKRTVNDNLFHPAVPRPFILWIHGSAFAGWVIFFTLPSRNCGSIPVPEAGPMCDKARFPWHRRCEIRRNVWLPHEVCC